ncbi:hypothetical protein ACFOGJ_18015 [Marinibaculum pumilum]|uniref:Uncharacterized protein n=1 Tax=Marinibaculum pumilum TaxID=1766165 RepID=A0ABV7L3E4_9PROT
MTRANTEDNDTTDAGLRLRVTTAPILTVDYDLYAHYLEDSDLSKEQKQEFLQALWSIIVDFVALGFEVHPVQQAQDACGKLPEKRRNQPESAPDSLKYRDQFTSKIFKKAAGGIDSTAEERNFE